MLSGQPQRIGGRVDTWAKSQAIRRLYARLPDMTCQGHCHESCGPVGMTTVELKALERNVGYSIDAVVHGPHEQAFIFAKPDLSCPVLKGKRCSAYSDRPLICRLWGMVEDMKCPYGCKPERYLTHGEALGLLAEAESIAKGQP